MLDWRWRPNKHAPLWASWVHAAAFVSPRVCSAGASQAPASCVAAPYTPPCDLRERNMCCTWWNHPTGAACAACVPVARAGEQGETCVLGVLATRGDVGTWQHELCYRVCGLVCVDSTGARSLHMHCASGCACWVARRYTGPYGGPHKPYTAHCRLCTAQLCNLTLDATGARSAN
jgi:hypothetical protein